MATNPSDARTARELLAMRNELHTGLPIDVITATNWRTVTDAAAPAIARGWTGHELARWVIADQAGTPADNPGALIVTTLRDLATVTPPRDTTSAPPPVAQVLAELHQRHQPATNPTHWAQRIRDTARR